MTEQNGLHPEVDSFIHTISGRLRNRDELEAENTQLLGQLTGTKVALEHSQTALKEITAERDRYMRMSLALRTRLNAIQDIIGATLDYADKEADAPKGQTEAQSTSTPPQQ